jgi:hypothetical protein
VDYNTVSAARSAHPSGLAAREIAASMSLPAFRRPAICQSPGGERAAKTAKNAIAAADNTVSLR